MISIGIIAAAVLFTELSGYSIHRLLHTGWVKWLSRSHLIHHSDIYPPTRLRSIEYISPAHASTFGIGLEWLVPVLFLLTPVTALAVYLGISLDQIALFICTSVAWALITLDWMHAQFHLTKPKLNSKWFKSARKAHDLHHMDVTVNFGISFYVLDRIFMTFRKRNDKKAKESLPRTDTN